MITKSLWEDFILNIQAFKEYKCLFKQSIVLDLYIGFISLIILTPILIVVDLLLSPLEICYYFFNKWIRN